MIRLETNLSHVSTSALTRLLAAEIAATFGEYVLILRPPKRGERSQTLPVRAEDGTFHAVASATSDLAARFADFDHVLLDGYCALPSGLVRTSIQISHAGSTERLPRSAPTILRTWLSDPCAPYSAGARISTAPDGRALDGVIADDTGPGEDLGACPLALPPSALAEGGVPRAALDCASRESLSRWARAVTGRRVGVALSGGGSWGFVHVALLRKLTKRGVPVDVVTGSSMGAAVGAYFAARGLDGLDRLVERAGRGDLDRTALLAIFSTASLERIVTLDLGPRRLEDLSVRFCPVATDLTEAASIAFVRGPLGRAVRASSSAPGLWAPTLDGPARYVDGAVSNHLPARLLRRFGATLTLASNSYPHDRGLSRSAPVSRVTELLRGLSPLGRAMDLMRSGSLLLHKSGDNGGRDADVFFDIAPQDQPLARAFRFRRANDVLAWTEQSRDLHRAVDEMASAWSALSRPRQKVLRRAA